MPKTKPQRVKEFKKYELGKQIVTELRMIGKGQVFFYNKENLMHSFLSQPKLESKFARFGINGMFFENLIILTNVEEILVKGSNLIFHSLIHAQN